MDTITPKRTGLLGVIGKQDEHARELWGDAYNAIPKSVFATMAWFLAGAASDNCDDPESIVARVLEELDALRGQVLPERQANAAIKAVRSTFTKAE